MGERLGVRCIQFSVVVTTALEGPNLVVGPVSNHCCGAGIAAEEVLADICTRFGFVRLKIAVRSRVHEVAKCAIGVIEKE